MVSNDRFNIFINPNEFGNEYIVEGKRITIVVDSDELKERQNGQDLAVAESATLFYANVEDLPKRRPAGENLNINGRECIIDSWAEDKGIATVVLRENIVM